MDGLFCVRSEPCRAFYLHLCCSIGARGTQPGSVRARSPAPVRIRKQRRNRFNDGQRRRGRGPSSRGARPPPTRSTRSATCGTPPTSHVRVRLPVVCQLHLAVADARLQGGVPVARRLRVRARLLLHNDAGRSRAASRPQRRRAAALQRAGPRTALRPDAHDLERRRRRRTCPGTTSRTTSTRRRGATHAHEQGELWVAGAQLIAFFPSILGSIQSNDFKHMQAQRRKGCAAARRPPVPATPPPRRAARRARASARPPLLSRLQSDHLGLVCRSRFCSAVLIALLIADWLKALLIYFCRAAAKHAGVAPSCSTTAATRVEVQPLAQPPPTR